ncbi:MAG: sel1 repeat family protein [Aestuariivirga sp.]|uniref:tetratricopeptide repeat protein n=1 Tax=Aestuariivirga sp. TaxID=2650926 RepID=UPI0025C686E9|nr:tetratricopeptide repeat protein [Aestuariivirga sp.]MCA3562558.1 sel1 repeat family protein [Aestuariivirga sp.]
MLIWPAVLRGMQEVRFGISNAALGACGLMLMLAPAAAADDDGKGPLSEFYSYLPAAPDIHLPEISIPFWTDDLKKAKRAYKTGDYARALKLFRRVSDDGNIVADWYLGHMYNQGVGVPRDDAMAYSYYTRVAEHYDPEETDPNRLKITVDAMVRLADYQRTGAVNAGIQPDPKAAAQNYLKIATAYGHPAAQFALGVMSIKGEGLKKNPGQGLKWLMAAARKRYAPAEAYLGDLYWSGQIVNADRTRAVMWYILARESARPDENPEIYARAKQIEASVGEDERIEAEARAKVWDDQYPAEKVKPAGD